MNSVGFVWEIGLNITQTISIVISLRRLVKLKNFRAKNTKGRKHKLNKKDMNSIMKDI